MQFCRASRYTLQALIYLARQPQDQFVMVRNIAKALDLPESFLGKLMQVPARAGWLITSRGRGGGVRLHPAAKNVSLFEILQLTDGHRVTRECLLGFKVCDDATACVMHCHWKPIKQELFDGLGSYTLTALASLPAALF